MCTGAIFWLCFDWYEIESLHLVSYVKAGKCIIWTYKIYINLSVHPCIPVGANVIMAAIHVREGFMEYDGIVDKTTNNRYQQNNINQSINTSKFILYIWKHPKRSEC